MLRSLGTTVALRNGLVEELTITPELVGRKVCAPGRPEWGQGTVLRVQSMTVAGQPVHRVSVQFASGHRTLVIPPGKLATPQAEPQRAAGWLDQAGRTTLDDQLASLPETVRDFLGSSSQRIVVLARLYALADDGESLLKWARSQTGVADPLAHWSRDELRAAFNEFCRRRDDLLRRAAAALRRAEGQRGMDEALAEVPDAARARMQAVLG